MNERIQELLSQAGLYVDLNGRPWPRNMSAEESEIAYEKFAELIVRECMFVVEDAVDHREPASTYVDKIKQHFGLTNVDDTLRSRSTYFGNNP
jgi:hypothetical protein